jgi:hypothetical protein
MIAAGTARMKVARDIPDQVRSTAFTGPTAEGSPKNWARKRAHARAMTPPISRATLTQVWVKGLAGGAPCTVGSLEDRRNMAFVC